MSKNFLADTSSFNTAWHREKIRATRASQGVLALSPAPTQAKSTGHLQKQKSTHRPPGNSQHILRKKGSNN